MKGCVKLSGFYDMNTVWKTSEHMHISISSLRMLDISIEVIIISCSPAVRSCSQTQVAASTVTPGFQKRAKCEFCRYCMALLGKGDKL